MRHHVDVEAWAGIPHHPPYCPHPPFFQYDEKSVKILYLVYGKQSGVIRYLTKALEARGAQVRIFDARGDLRYRHEKIRLPSLKPFNVLNSIVAISQFGKKWKANFFKTEYAFLRMSQNANVYIRKHAGAYDLILQSGALFSATKGTVNVPYFLYLDNTTTIHEQFLRKRFLKDGSAPSERWKDLERQAYEASDWIFTMSDFVKRSLVEDYSIPKRKISVVGAGPNLEVMPEFKDKRYNSQTIIFVGKDFDRKGGRVLLKAFQEVRKELPNAKLLIIGPKDVIVGPGIECIGSVDFRQMPEIYSKGTIFVMPTLQEPFGLSFLEAMAHRLPCVGTEIQAIPEIVEDGETGFVVPVSDHDELARKIILLLNDEGLMERMGKKGYEKVRQHYTWDIVATKILSRLREDVCP